MEVIQKGNETKAAICGKQKVLPGQKLRQSVFTLTENVSNGKLIFNTLSGELIFLPHDENTESAELIGKLAERWFYVPENFDEFKYLRQITTVAELMVPKTGKLTHFRIFTTTDCNARCYYCYEQGTKKIHMSEKTAHDTAKFIIKSSKGEKVHLHWFGGEPLYNSKVIDLITDDLKEAGVEYCSEMTSNGYLFDSDTIKKADNKWKLKKVQITLDGTEKKYNKTKAFIYDNANGFRTVIDNICELSSFNVEIVIRLNLSGMNCNDMQDLIEELASIFREKSNIFIYTAVLRDFIGKVSGFESMDDAFKWKNKLNNKIQEAGFARKQIISDVLRINQCMASNDQTVTVLPGGHLGKCEFYTDKEYVGDIYNGITDREAVTSWKETLPPTELCMKCPMFPLCSVRLKKCPANKNECEKAAKEEYIFLTRKQMSSTYDYYMKKGKSI